MTAMTTSIQGINNSGGDPLELEVTVDNDDGLYVSLQIRDYDTGEERSVEMLVEDIDFWIEFLTNTKDEAHRAKDGV